MTGKPYQRQEAWGCHYLRTQRPKTLFSAYNPPIGYESKNPDIAAMRRSMEHAAKQIPELKPIDAPEFGPGAFMNSPAAQQCLVYMPSADGSVIQASAYNYQNDPTFDTCANARRFAHLFR